MATVLIKVGDAQFQRKIQAMTRGLVDASALMRQWGEIAHASVTENFEVGGRPRWKRLSQVTIKKKGHDRPLIGRTGNLSRITMRPDRLSVQLGTHPSARAYAAIHQFGGRAGRNLKVLIPARPYMMLQPEDVVEMRETARSYLKKLAA